jgi:hypothetical protein
MAVAKLIIEFAKEGERDPERFERDELESGKLKAASFVAASRRDSRLFTDGAQLGNQSGDRLIGCRDKSGEVSFRPGTGGGLFDLIEVIGGNRLGKGGRAY